jgi:tRNA pseudouridine38-40 synthase
VTGPPVRLRLDIGYDGSDFAGWARQPGRRSVQGVIEDALALLLRLDPPAPLTVAGRTDAGVHARGQVAHVDVPAEAYAPVAGALTRRLARLLPADVRVRRVQPAAGGFDARFSALARRYSYRVSDDPTGVDPLRRRDVLGHPRPLDLDRMNTAAAALLGEHDFAAYCRRREGATTIRRLLRCEWTRADPIESVEPEVPVEPGEPAEPAGPSIAVATVEADAFCHSMVRALVGALLAVGDGRKPVEWPGEVLRRGLRDPAVHVAPPYGLCLEQVRYPAPGELARQAGRTRRLRVLAPPVPPTTER